MEGERWGGGGGKGNQRFKKGGTRNRHLGQEGKTFGGKGTEKYSRIFKE